jgi:FkbM family methyltransferase
VFVDVGANIGTHAVFFGKFLADHVVAVEPHPDLARILERNLRTNGIRGYSLVRCALGEAPGTGRLLLPAGQENNLGGTRVTGLHEPASAAAGALAPIGTLDDTLASLDPAIARLPVRLVKVDVEGMEMAVLRGRARAAPETGTSARRRAVRRGRPRGRVRPSCRARLPTARQVPGVGRTDRALRPAATWTGFHRRAGRRPNASAARFQRLEHDPAAVLPDAARIVLVDDGYWCRDRVAGPAAVPLVEREGQYWGVASRRSCRDRRARAPPAGGRRLRGLRLAGVLMARSTSSRSSGPSRW